MPISSTDRCFVWLADWLQIPSQDFVRLASWEDRGYYAMRASTEKAQRHLHRLTRNAAEVTALSTLLTLLCKVLNYFAA